MWGHEPTVLRRIAVCNYCGLVVLLLALTPHFSQASETTAASGHICSGCPTCDLNTHVAAKSIDGIDHFHRAGHPETVGRFARPSLDQHDSFGYVGGSSAFRGEPRLADEGTWGVDYSGILLKKQIWLRWRHGQRETCHDGSYHTDGPHLLAR